MGFCMTAIINKIKAIKKWLTMGKKYAPIVSTISMIENVRTLIAKETAGMTPPQKVEYCAKTLEELDRIMDLLKRMARENLMLQNLKL